MYYWNKVRMVCCQVMKHAQIIHARMKLTVIALSKSTSILVMVLYRALKFVTHLEYEYAQVTVDLICENITLVHCSVLVCNGPYSLLFHVSYFILCSIYGQFASLLSIDCKWCWGCRHFWTSDISMFCIEAIELITRYLMYYTF